MASDLLSALGISLPVLAAPMAGGPTTPRLVSAAAAAGGLGFLAGGYKTPDVLAAEISTVVQESIPFGVNLFVPNPVPVDPVAFRRYAELIAPEAAHYGIELSGVSPVEDDDSWPDKIELLRDEPVPVVSFTFAIPAPHVLALLRASGALLVQTVTSLDEARQAAEAGLDALAVQSDRAGGHYGTFTPRRPAVPVAAGDLVASIRASVRLPVIAAGGVGTAEDVAAAIGAGAEAVAVGTALLRADEAGTSDTHQAALADPARRGTVVTHAFTGRPARALRNAFTDRYDGSSPFGYPAIHHLTGPLRRAAAAAGDPERVHLWAGTGYRHATAGPCATILERLAERS